MREVEAIEMWICRCMKKMSWMDKNQLKSSLQRQLRFVGHIVGEDSIEKLSLEGKVKGYRSRGKQRKDFL